jgi:hypothetical protein
MVRGQQPANTSRFIVCLYSKGLYLDSANGCGQLGTCYSHDDCLVGLRCLYSTHKCVPLCNDTRQDSTESSVDCGYAGIAKRSLFTFGAAPINTTILWRASVMTISIWARNVNTGNNDRGLMTTAKKSVNSTGGWSLLRRANGAVAFWPSPSTYGIAQTAAGVMSINTAFYHIVAVIRADYRVEIWLNGELQTISRRIMLNALTVQNFLHIGNVHIDATSVTSWAGYIERVAIYDSILNKRQIRGLWRGEPTMIHGPSIPSTIAMRNMLYGATLPSYAWDWGANGFTEYIYGNTTSVPASAASWTLNTNLSPINVECRVKCSGGSSCIVNGDCDTGLSCYWGTCIINSTCHNLIQDIYNNETGIDCGSESSCGWWPTKITLIHISQTLLLNR